ncbi:hypothetical protein PoB_007592800 [Plakobranchus ocellatus]|uniref:Uncharacterized protein n=1 Tax=Plakobranchus ocellatus TaxID=259542 RepID=A0AAV4DYI4_9GAST|nr:hypothetical protein PoB_007592800 [Plakobranchus ocellatus]
MLQDDAKICMALGLVSKSTPLFHENMISKSDNATRGMLFVVAAVIVAVLYSVPWGMLERRAKESIEEEELGGCRRCMLYWSSWLLACAFCDLTQ